MTDWRAPEGCHPVSPGGVHVWLAVMPEGWPVSTGLLSEEERARAGRFAFDRGRAWFSFHHTALRLILARYTGLDPRCIPVAAQTGGKPFLEAPWGSWRFSLSHCGPVSLCAVAAEREVGVDVERLRPMPDAARLAARFFSPGEREALERLDGSAREAAFFACWTRKEALLKATGDGLGRPLDSFAVPVDPACGDPWRVDGRWTGLALPPIPGHACALVVEGEPLPVYGWELRRAKAPAPTADNPP